MVHLCLPSGHSIVGLDGYFLHQERLFRKHYDPVLKLSEDKIDFSMNTTIFEDKINS